MNLEEIIERAFEAGADFVIDNTNVEFDNEIIDFPGDRETSIALTEYINGNLKSSESASVLHQSHGGSI